MASCWPCSWKGGIQVSGNTPQLKHARLKRTSNQPDGTKLIQTESYYEDLSSYEEQVEQKIKTSKHTFLADLMKAVAPISDGVSRNVTLAIEADDNNIPYRIIQTVTVKKEHYGRR